MTYIEEKYNRRIKESKDFINYLKVEYKQPFDDVFLKFEISLKEKPNDDPLELLYSILKDGSYNFIVEKSKGLSVDNMFTLYDKGKIYIPKPDESDFVSDEEILAYQDKFKGAIYQEDEYPNYLDFGQVKIFDVYKYSKFMSKKLIYSYYKLTKRITMDNRIRDRLLEDIDNLNREIFSYKFGKHYTDIPHESNNENQRFSWKSFFERILNILF